MSGQSSDGVLVGLAAIVATVLLVVFAGLMYGCDSPGRTALQPTIQETR